MSKVKVPSVSELVTRSPIELLWTAKNTDGKKSYQNSAGSKMNRFSKEILKKAKNATKAKTLDSLRRTSRSLRVFGVCSED